jgi:chromosomal replication initiation ATPase DnaA
MSNDTLSDKLSRVEFALTQHYGVPLKALSSIAREKELVRARQAVWTIAFVHLGFSYPRLAERYKRDHTTIMHGVKKVRGTKAETEALAAVSSHFPGLITK